MNILFDQQIFQAQRYGGISRYFLELVSRLPRQSGIDVSLFQGLHINQYGLDRHRSEFRNYAGLLRPDLAGVSPRIFSAMNRLGLRFAATSWRPDIYHPTYYADGLPGFKRARVVTVYDMIHELYPSEFDEDDRTAEHKLALLAKADRIIAISESTRNDLIRLLKIPAEKIRVIYLANPLTTPPTSLDPALTEKPYLLYVGIRRGYKNFPLLLEAFSRSSRLKKDFRLISFGGGAFTEKENKSIHALGLDGQVIQVPGGDALLSALYRNAAAFVYPSLYEGFGLPILEAMYAGCPVVCGDTSSLPEVAGQAAKLFDARSEESLRAALDAVVWSPSERDRLVAAGRAREQSSFSWDRCALETAAVYKEVAGLTAS